MILAHNTQRDLHCVLTYSRERVLLSLGGTVVHFTNFFVSGCLFDLKNDIEQRKVLWVLVVGLRRCSHPGQGRQFAQVPTE